MTTYLSGPITLGWTATEPDAVNRNLDRFRATRETLQAAGIDVADPTLLPPPNPDPGWLDWMRACLRLLLDCDRVLMLPGWEHSRGARIERRLAEDLGLVVEEWAAVTV